MEQQYDREEGIPVGKSNRKIKLPTTDNKFCYESISQPGKSPLRSDPLKRRADER